MIKKGETSVSPFSLVSGSGFAFALLMLPCVRAGEPMRRGAWRRLRASSVAHRRGCRGAHDEARAKRHAYSTRQLTENSRSQNRKSFVFRYLVASFGNLALIINPP